MKEINSILRILFLEDLSTDVELSERELRKDNLTFTSIRVETKEEFLNALIDFHPDLIISDYELPLFNGLQALDLSLKYDPTIPFIITTGSMNEDTAVVCMKAGATDYVIKEHITRLPFAVREALEKKKAQAQKDISEKKLEEERNLLQVLLNNIPDAIYFKDTESRFIRINQAQASRFGLKDPIQAVGRTDFDFFTELHARQAYEDEQSIIRLGQPMVGKEEEETWPDGRKGWVSSTKMPLRNKEGGIVGTFGISRDITGLKQAQIEILTYQERMNLVLDSGKIGVFDWDMITDTTWRTLKHDQIFGYDSLQPEWRLENFLQRIVSEDSELIKTQMDKAFLSGEFNFECRIQRTDKLKRWIACQGNVYNSKAGKPVRVLGTISDITERKSIELSLQKRITELETVNKISTLLQKGRNLHESLNILLDETLAAIGFCDGWILLHDLTTQKLKPIATRGWFRKLENFCFSVYEEIGGHVFTEDVIYISKEIINDGLTSSKYRNLIPPQWMGVYLPIHSSEEKLGVISVSCSLPRKINEDELRLMTIIAGLAGNIASQVQLREKIQQSLEELQKEVEQRKMIQELLTTEKEILTTTLFSIGEGVIATDEEGLIILYNHSAEEILGYQTAEALDQPFDNIFQILDPDTGQVITNVIDTLYEMDKLQKKNPNYRSPTLLTKSGKKVLAQGSIASIRSANGKLLGHVNVFKNITELQKLEAQSILSQKMEAIGQLAAGIAHEINTPIQYIGDNLGFLNRAFSKYSEVLDTYQQITVNHLDKPFTQNELDLLENVRIQKKINHYIKEIPASIQEARDGIERVRKIVMAIREFSHPSQKEKRTSDINHGIETTITISRNEWKYVAEVETDLDPMLPPVNCQIDEINQVILNMIVNAAQSIQEGMAKDVDQKGKIRIVTRKEDNKAIIAIQDTGCGIQDAIRERIFDPFFTTKGVGKGTGQGLSMAYNIIVKKHNGKIYVNSEVGRGTTFTIELPLDIEGR